MVDCVQRQLVSHSIFSCAKMTWSQMAKNINYLFLIVSTINLKKRHFVFFSFSSSVQSLPTSSPLSFSVSLSASACSYLAWSCRATGRWTSPGRKMEDLSLWAWVWRSTTSTSPAHCESTTWHLTTTATTPASPATRPPLWSIRVSLLFEVGKGTNFNLDLTFSSMPTNVHDGFTSESFKADFWSPVFVKL